MRRSQGHGRLLGSTSQLAICRERTLVGNIGASSDPCSGRATISGRSPAGRRHSAGNGTIQAERRLLAAPGVGLRYVAVTRSRRPAAAPSHTGSWLSQHENARMRPSFRGTVMLEAAALYISIAIGKKLLDRTGDDVGDAFDSSLRKLGRWVREKLAGRPTAK